MRQRFEENRNIVDERKALKMVEDGEKELFENQHYQPRLCKISSLMSDFNVQFGVISGPNSPGGVAFGREVDLPDWLLDYWHPLEKARYPEYFARREQRKKEWVEMWEKQYGKPKPDEHAHH